jgi:RNA polymerase sigma-70 factor (ECF subfamily)
MFRQCIQTDATLVRSVLAGRREDFGSLVERHLSTAFAVAYGRTGNHADAEDAAQEAFLRALKTLDRLREPAKFGPWLITITRNVATDILIARTREHNAGADTPILDDAIWLPNMEQREMWSKLREQIRQLDEEPREVLLLFYFAGKPTKEIAALLSVSPDAVRKRLQRARETLGTRLLEELQPERKLQPVLKKRSAIVTAAALAAPVTWQTAGATTLPAVAGIAAGKWVAAIVVVVVGLAGLFAATRESERPIPPAPEENSSSIHEETSLPAATGTVAQPAIAQQSVTTDAPAATTTPATDTIRGRVVNAGTGKGVNLSVMLSGEIRGGESIHIRGREDGAFEINVSGYGYGKFTVSCGNDGKFASASVDGVRRPGEAIPEILLEVHELATVSGRVLRADGTPVPRASIMRHELGMSVDTVGSAGDDGYYFIHHDGGDLTLAARRGELWSGFAEFELEKHESVTHDFVLPESGEIRITLQTSDGSAVPSIHDSVLMTKGATSPYLLAERISDNVFLVRDLPYEEYSIAIRAEGYELAELTGIQISSDRPKASANALLRRSTHYDVTFRVLDPEGNPLPDAGVIMNVLTERLDAHGNVQAKLENQTGQNGIKTDSNGEWTTSVPAGFYRAFCINETGRGETHVTVPDEGSATIQLVHPDHINYRLEVLDGLDGDKPLSTSDICTLIVHNDGTIADRLAAGINHIVVVKEGYTAFLDTVALNPGSSDEPVVVRAVLGKSGTIEGALYAADGSPKIRTELCVFPELLWRFAVDQWPGSWVQFGLALGQRARTRDDGSFTIDHLPQGRYVVAFDENIASAPIDVVPGMVTGPVEINTD